MNSGANDPLAGHGCRYCGAVFDGLIIADLTGAMPDFVDVARGDRADVIWIGYYASYRSDQIVGCCPYLVEYGADGTLGFPDVWPTVCGQRKGYQRHGPEFVYL